MMARILDKDTRLIDIDFGPLTVGVTRGPGDLEPTAFSTAGNGVQQLLNVLTGEAPNTGSFIQYSRIDLDYMVKNNEIVIPVDASIQRTSPVPLGSNLNGNTFDQIEEYVYVFTRPLNNNELSSPTFVSGDYEDLRDMGLDRSGPLTQVVSPAGFNAISGKAGWPNQSQCIYAEKRMYSYNESLGATINNGELTSPPANISYNSIMSMQVLYSVTTWGAMEGINGPNLTAYRKVVHRTQTFPAVGAGIFTSAALGGTSSLNFPPVSIRFLCKDPDYSEGQYLTRLANAMNNIAEDGPTA